MVTIICPHCEKEISASHIAKEMGRSGGLKTKTRHGYDFYVAVGKKGAMCRWGKTDKT